MIAFIFARPIVRRAGLLMQSVMPLPPTAGVGEGRSQETVAMLADLESIRDGMLSCVESKRQVSEELKVRLERYLSPATPYEARCRAMLLGHLVGRARLRPYLKAAMADASARVRAMAIDCAIPDDGFDIAMAPPALESDTDPAVRAAWLRWQQAVVDSLKTGSSRDPDRLWLPAATGESPAAH